MQRLLLVLLGLFVSLSAVAGLPPVKVQKINDHAYALLGPLDVPNKQNGGYMNNSLVLIGDKGVILVDSGSHKAVGEHIKAAIAKITPKPVTYILVTHHHGDHHLGNVAFPGAHIISSSNCKKLIEEKGYEWVGIMERSTGQKLLDTKPVAPQETITSQSHEDMTIDGIKLELIAPQTAHTEGDMMVWVPEDHILAAGDILVHMVAPNFVDGNVKQWVAVVDDILKIPAQTIVPGHGPLMSHEDIIEFRSLIADFYKGVEDVYKSGGGESEVRKKIDLSRWEKLARYEQMMGGNINKTYLEVESENF